MSEPEKHCPMCHALMEFLTEGDEPPHWQCLCGFKEYAMPGKEYRERFGED